MSTSINTSSGNPIVDQLGKIELTGNIIPEAWYKTIVNNKNHVNCMAMLILADIVYWYKPVEIRDESGLHVRYAKRFKDKDYLQRSYEQLCDKFNISKKQARDCIVMLEELGVIKRHLRTINTPSGKTPNVLYIELIPSRLCELTFPDNNNNGSSSDDSECVDTSLQICRDLPTKKETHVSEKVDTNTENTTEISTEITTTDADVVAAHALLYPFRLTDQDINSILKAARNNLSRIEQAISLLHKQHNPITNIAGWLISALTKNYSIPNSLNTTGELLSCDEDSLRLIEQLYLNEVASTT